MNHDELSCVITLFDGVLLRLLLLSYGIWEAHNLYDLDACVAEEPVQLGLLMPMTGSWRSGLQISGAAALAVEQVNANNALLPGRWLEYSWADSGCSAKQGLAAIGELLRGENRISAVIGPGCSSACEVTSYLSGGQGIPQISWACTSPTLSNKAEFELVLFSVTMRLPSKQHILVAV